MQFRNYILRSNLRQRHKHKSSQPHYPLVRTRGKEASLKYFPGEFSFFFFSSSQTIFCVALTFLLMLFSSWDEEIEAAVKQEYTRISHIITPSYLCSISDSWSIRGLLCRSNNRCRAAAEHRGSSSAHRAAVTTDIIILHRFLLDKQVQAKRVSFHPNYVLHSCNDKHLYRYLF